MTSNDLVELSGVSPEKTAAPRLQIETVNVSDRLNQKWKTHHIEKTLTVARNSLINSEDTVFTIGSCFAEQIRIFLDRFGVKVGPPYADLIMAPDRYQIDTLPHQPHMNYYNSFTVRQEFERHIGTWEQSPDDYWTTKDTIWGGETAYQDPYRRLVFGRTPDDLHEAITRINAIMDLGISSSNVYFITLGMAEVFRNKATGLIACQKPLYGGGAGAEETEFHMSSYEENYANMVRVVEIIDQVRPGANIFVTVSPVALARTFSENDVVVANMEGKSILRAVLGALDRKFENVTYFPSYEIVLGSGAAAFRQKDGRHVDPLIAGKIVRAFVDAHYDGAVDKDEPLPGTSND